jgi:DNA-binding MarR family transcriptional regulator
LRDLVPATPSLTDVRRLEVPLSPAGEAAMADLIAAAHQVSQATTSRLSPREEQQLLALLGKLIDQTAP